MFALRPLPVLRVRFADPSETWFYVDPEMSQMMARIHRLNRLERWLHRVDVPTLVVWGKEDRIFAPAHAEAFHKAIPGSRLAMVDRAGHLPHVERLEEVHGIISGFLAG